MRLSIILPSSAPWKIFGTSFQSSQHIADVVLLKLCNDFYTFNYVNPKIPRSKQGRWTSLHILYIKLKVPYICMICRACVLHTNRKRFLHLSNGETGKYLRQILSKFSRYCSLYHCLLNFTSCTASDHVISTVCLWSLHVKTS